MLTAAALAFAINIGGGIFNWIFQKAGRLATQATIFVLALLAAVYWQYHGLVPGLADVITGAIVLFSMAVAFYEVLLGYFPAFAGPTDKVPSA